MSTANLICWNCGTPLPEMPLPVGRGEECPRCVSSVRVCRMCRFYDPDASNDCREIMADVVADKQAANTCDYFSPRTPEIAEDGDEARESRARLDAVFGKEKETTPGGGLAQEAEALKAGRESEADAARRKLEEMFGGKED